MQRRVDAVILANFGIQYKGIASILAIHPNSVANVIAMYNQGGLERLEPWREGDADTELGGFDRRMRERWNRNPPRAVKEAAAHLEKVAGVWRGLTGVRNYLKFLACLSAR